MADLGFKVTVLHGLTFKPKIEGFGVLVWFFSRKSI